MVNNSTSARGFFPYPLGFWFIVLLCLQFIPLVSFASEDVLFSSQRRNILYTIQCEFVGNHAAYGDWQITEDLADRLIGEKAYNGKIYVYFLSDYTCKNFPHTALSFGDYFFQSERHAGKKSPNGIRLIIRNRYLNTREFLLLLSYAIDNLNYIKASQRESPINWGPKFHDDKEIDTVLTIPFPVLERVLASKDSLVDKLVSERTFRKGERNEDYGSLDYFYQDNKFHVYAIQDDNNDNYLELGDSKNRETDAKAVLVLDNVKQIFGNSFSGYLVFSNDSQFFYVNSEASKAIGPYYLAGMNACSPVVHKWDYDNDPIRKFTLFYTNKRRLSKAVFFPDSNLVINKYDKLEYDMVKDVFRRQKEYTPTKLSFVRQYALHLLLGLSVFVNCVLAFGIIIKRKK